MTAEVLVNEPVDLLYRVMPSGAIRPTSFIWRHQTRYVDTIGRTWEERVQGATLRCFMIQTVEGNTFEIRFDPAQDQWFIQRAWLRDLVV
ncbi:MAG: hypothetical protein WDZ49_07675 [Litorilinea sp.]